MIAIPGTGYPVDRLVEELAGVRQALLAFDGDDAGRAYSNRAARALAAAGVQPAPVELPDGRDLADLLAEHGSAAKRGDWLANLLADAGCAAEPRVAAAAEPSPLNGDGCARDSARDCG